MENNGKYDDYLFPAGRMAWNGFVLVSLKPLLMCFQFVHESSECLTGRVRSE